MDERSPTLRDDLLVHAGFVRAMARGALEGDAEREDLEQDVWVAALEGAPRRPERQRSWLAAVIRNRAVDRFRRRSRRAARERAAARPEAVASAAEVAAHAETGRRLVAAVLELETIHRDALLLRFHEGLPPREVATRLGVPVETARTRIKRGLARLRARLEEREGRRWAVALAPLARAPAPAGGLVTFAVLGGFAVKKVAVALVALLLLGAGAWWTLRPTTPSAASRAGDGPRVAAAPPTDAPGAGPLLAGQGKPPHAPEATPSAAQPTAGSVIRGQVVDEEGRPVEGATVGCAAPQGDFLKEDAPASAADGARAARTGADGRFEIRREGFVNQQSLGVRAPGYVLRDGDYFHQVTWKPDGKDLTVVLRRGVVVTVKVVRAEDGTPLAGARAELLDGQGYVHYADLVLDEDVTDEGGTAHLTAPGGAVTVVVTATGRAQWGVLGLSAAPPGVETVVRLALGTTVRGVVTDPDGKAVAGAKLALLRFPRVRLFATSGPDGSFGFDHVPTGVGIEGVQATHIVTLACEVEGFKRQWRVLTPPAEGRSVEVPFVLTALRTVTGTIRNGEGRPVGGLPWRYALQEGGPEWGWSQYSSRPGGKTSEDGAFRIEGVQPGLLLLWVGPATRDDPDTATLKVEIRPDAPTPPLDALYGKRPAVRSVRVVDAEGNGVAGARLTLYEDALRDGGSHAEVPTDAAGEATVTLDGDGAWTLFVDPPRAGPLVVRVPAERPATEKTLVTLGSDRIDGRVQRLDGSPAPVEVALGLTHRLAAHSVGLVGRLGSAQADAKGRVRFDRVAPQKHGLEVVTPGWRLLDPPRDLAPGGAPFAAWVLDAAQAAALTLAADVVDAGSGGKPPVAVTVVAKDAEGADRVGLYTTVQQPTVFAAQEPVRPGTYTIVARAEGYEPAEIRVVVDARGPAVRARLELRRR